MPAQSPIRHIVRIDITNRGDTDRKKLLLTSYLKQALGVTNFTAGPTAVLFLLPDGVDTLMVANVMERLHPDIKEIVKRTVLFADSGEAEEAA